VYEPAGRSVGRKGADAEEEQIPEAYTEVMHSGAEWTAWPKGCEEGAVAAETRSTELASSTSQADLDGAKSQDEVLEERAWLNLASAASAAMKTHGADATSAVLVHTAVPALSVWSSSQAGAFGLKLCPCCERFSSTEDEGFVIPPLVEGVRTGHHKRTGSAPGGHRLEALLQELFKLHDLNGDGVLSELELIRLNEAVAVLHHGDDVETGAVETKYRELFRQQLDPEGQPVPFKTFRGYLLRVLGELDCHEEAQEMMVEQFIAEARLARSIGGLRVQLCDGSEMQQDIANISRSRQELIPSCLGFCSLKESVLELRRGPAEAA